MTLTGDQRAALAQLRTHHPEAQIVLIGAAALELQSDLGRSTADVDLIAAIDLQQHEALADLPGWRHGRQEHEFTAANNVRLDILPISSASQDLGFLEWRSGHRMNLAGLDLAFDHARALEVAPGLTIGLAPPSVIMLLKMVAYLDRAAERERDLADIAHIMTSYLEDDDVRRWASETYFPDFELASAYVLGRDLGEIAKPQHRDQAEKFLDLVGNREDWHYAKFSQRGPDTWKSNEDKAERHLEAFRAGLDGVHYGTDAE